MKFEQRLEKNRKCADEATKVEFIGCIMYIDPYNFRAVIQKTKEKENSSYSFSVDQIRAADYLEIKGIPVTVKLEDGRSIPWKQIRVRLDTVPSRYQVVTL